MLNLSECHSFPLFNSKTASERLEEGSYGHKGRMALEFAVYPVISLVSTGMSYTHMFCSFFWIFHLNFTIVEFLVYSLPAKLGPSSLPHLLDHPQASLAYNRNSHLISGSGSPWIQNKIASMSTTFSGNITVTVSANFSVCPSLTPVLVENSASPPSWDWHDSWDVWGKLCQVPPFSALWANVTFFSGYGCPKVVAGIALVESLP